MKHFKTLFTCTITSLSLLCYSQNSATNTFARDQEFINELHNSVTWGPPASNGVQIGISGGRADSDPRFSFTIATFMSSSNRVNGLFFPTHGYRLALSLKDSAGNSVAMTKSGDAISKPIGIFERARINRESGSFTDSFGLFRYDDPFSVLDSFRLEHADKYTLSVGAILYRLDQNGGLSPITVPAVSMKLIVTQEDLGQHQALH